MDLSWLRAMESDANARFVADRRVMSFDTYFEHLLAAPAAGMRTAAAYIKDCFEHFGVTSLDRPTGAMRRFNLFDSPWSEGRDRVVGQEAAQEQLYRAIVNFAREGRVTRLILLHGPNGSAKSSVLSCLAGALEAYSKTEAGALYHFNWVFPTRKTARKRLGFQGANDERRGIGSFAGLDDDEIDARIPGDLRDHPLLLLAPARRTELFEQLAADGTLPSATRIGQYLLHGDLSPRSRAIFDSLHAAYHGDLQRVFQHIQVERFDISARYRVGSVTVEPQLHVDASTRQIAADSSPQSLPAALRWLSLYEPMGDLVEANRGLLEFNDLLKRPLDSFKYLLATCEKGTVALPNAILHLDMVFVATSNDTHLEAFKSYNDFASFKARMDLIKMPYIREISVEQEIYDAQAKSGELGPLVAPHATYIAALWAVLTRLRKPGTDGIPKDLAAVVQALTPIEKAELYAGTREPAELTPEQSRNLWAAVPDLLNQGQETEVYEGGVGASPRVVKAIMLRALQDPNYTGLSALAVVDALRALVKKTSIYGFLQETVDGGFHDHEAFIDVALERYLDRLDREVRTAMGLVSEGEVLTLFERYILHISYAMKGERLYDEATGTSEDPDRGLMERLEGIWGARTPIDGFRGDLISRIGAWRIDFPGAEFDYRRLFPKLFAGLEADYFKEQRDPIRHVGETALAILRGDEDARALSADLDRAKAEAMIGALVDDFGHPRPMIADALGALLQRRYA